MALQKQEDPNLRKDASDKLNTAGGKRSWERTVDAMPSDPDDDPKDHERNKEDFSFREGPFGPPERRPGETESPKKEE